MIVMYIIFIHVGEIVPRTNSSPITSDPITSIVIIIENFQNPSLILRLSNPIPYHYFLSENCLSLSVTNLILHVVIIPDNFLILFLTLYSDLKTCIACLLPFIHPWILLNPIPHLVFIPDNFYIIFLTLYLSLKTFISYPLPCIQPWNFFVSYPLPCIYLWILLYPIPYLVFIPDNFYILSLT